MIISFRGEIAKLDAENKKLLLYKQEHERLKSQLNKILHPEGDAPLKPSFCDLVAYIRSDLQNYKELKEENEKLRKLLNERF